MAGIYPTPPDGLMPHHMINQPSTTDSHMTSMLTDHADPHTDVQLSTGDEVPDVEQDLSSPTAPQRFQSNGDDVFGDIGDNLEFGVNEVADADFDYFDEPDEEPNHFDAADGGQDVEMAEPTIPDPASDTETQPCMTSGLDDEAPEVVIEVTDDAHHAVADLETQQTISETMNDISTTVTAQNEESNRPRASPTLPPEKPLSPFGIRERLLPPPIPASATSQQSDTTGPNSFKRSSTFEPVSFHDGLDMRRKYSTGDFLSKSPENHGTGPDISLPTKRKKYRPRWRHQAKDAVEPDSGVGDMMDTTSSSEEDDYNSGASESDEAVTPFLTVPWDTRKRKRDLEQLPSPVYARRQQAYWSHDDSGGENNASDADDKMNSMLSELLKTRGEALGGHDNAVHGQHPRRIGNSGKQLKGVAELFTLSKMDLLFVAQIVGEQAISTTELIRTALYSGDDLSDVILNTNLASAIIALVDKSISHAFPESVEACNLSKLALIKEAPTRQPSNLGKAPATPQNMQARPHPVQRDGNMSSGPDYFPIASPYIRIQRGTSGTSGRGDTWEMLPPALSFWSALGLGPANGAKDVRIVTIIPSNQDLAGVAKEFVDSLGAAYESNKLGGWKDLHQDFMEDLEDCEGYADSMVHVTVTEIEGEESDATEKAMKAYATACTDLGKALARAGHQDPERTIVVLLVDPFDRQSSHNMLQHLCACFWMLYKAYRDHNPKQNRTTPRSDIILQVLPISLITKIDGLVALDAMQLSMLAMEIYDRCPPSSSSNMVGSLSSNIAESAAPAVELAPVPPKRIAFQLTPDPPSDLLHEGSVMHLAYAVSDDRMWMGVMLDRCHGQIPKR